MVLRRDRALVAPLSLSLSRVAIKRREERVGTAVIRHGVRRLLLRALDSSLLAFVARRKPWCAAWAVALRRCV